MDEIYKIPAYKSIESGHVFYLNKDGKYQRIDAAFHYTFEQLTEFCTPIALSETDLIILQNQ